MAFQKQSVVVLAPAKLNLSLDVVGLLPNGYHDLDMVMQAITICFFPIIKTGFFICLSSRISFFFS